MQEEDRPHIRTIGTGFGTVKAICWGDLIILHEIEPIVINRVQYTFRAELDSRYDGKFQPRHNVSHDRKVLESTDYHWLSMYRVDDYVSINSSGTEAGRKKFRTNVIPIVQAFVDANPQWIIEGWKAFYHQQIEFAERIRNRAYKAFAEAEAELKGWEVKLNELLSKNETF